MSDAAMVLGTADRLMADQCDDATVRRARRGAWPASLWNAIAQMGLPLALVPEGSGGFGLDPVDAFALARLAGRHALPLPLGETMAANQALALAGLPLAEGPAAFVPVESGLVLRDGRITGTADRVPWGATVGTLVVEYLLGGARHVARLDSGWRVAESGTNIAHMPRDWLSIDAAITATAPAQGHPLYLMGAGLRVLQIAGALDQVLDLSIAHVSDRKQFGRALATFQAIQHELARIAGEAAAAGAAAGLAAEALAEAERLDAIFKTSGPVGPLHGIPILIKDNIDSADRMKTSAGSLALAASTPPRDAFIVAKLREAGAVLLGKTNLSEWANYRSTHATSGWSGRGGQTRNPYVLDRNPGGSSAGTGAAIAAAFAKPSLLSIMAITMTSSLKRAHASASDRS